MTATALVAVSACAQQSVNTSIPQAVLNTSEQTNLPLDRNKILKSHNEIRQRIGVPNLRWSARLESLAAEWANYLSTDAGCITRRRGMIGLPQHKNGLGENLQRLDAVRFNDGRTEIAKIDENQVVLNWARQGIDFDYVNNRCAANKTCENYTQLVWRDSQVVGCAVASCPGLEQIWVCHYDPPGNYAIQKPY